MKLIYFAWLRTKIGVGEEELPLPDGVATVGELVAWLRTRGPAYAEALANSARLRVAVNQEYAGFDTALSPGDEVALFPPVTGG